MDTKLLKTAEKDYMKKNIPVFDVGDTIAVHTIIREKDKQRIQIFRGIVIAIKNSGARRTFTVRRISSGIGVEKIFPLYSPNIKKIEFIKKGHVRRSKLYYMRNRIGKQAMKIKEGILKLSQKKQHDSVKEKAKDNKPNKKTAVDSNKKQKRKDDKNKNEAK